MLEETPPLAVSCSLALTSPELTFQTRIFPETSAVASVSLSERCLAWHPVWVQANRLTLHLWPSRVCKRVSHDKGV